VAAVGVSRLEPMQIVNLREQVRNGIRQAIIDGRLVPRTRLNERSVALDLGVSTTPVKDAFRLLEQEGFLRSEPRRGVYVSFDREQAEEMVLARAAIERVIAGRAAARAQAEDLAAMQTLLARMEQATAQGQADALVELNRRFHQAIHAASGCGYLPRMLQPHAAYDRATRTKLFEDPAARARAYAEHAAIGALIAAGTANQAEQAMYDHVIQSGAAYVERLFGRAGGRAQADAGA
jgi:DNA-binding GntR family transcriptional regulator